MCWVCVGLTSDLVFYVIVRTTPSCRRTRSRTSCKGLVVADFNRSEYQRRWILRLRQHISFWWAHVHDRCARFVPALLCTSALSLTKLFSLVRCISFDTALKNLPFSFFSTVRKRLNESFTSKAALVLCLHSWTTVKEYALFYIVSIKWNAKSCLF